jgi:hypothetical protein
MNAITRDSVSPTGRRDLSSLIFRTLRGLWPRSRAPPASQPKRFYDMSKLMLIDATHPEETRVAVVNERPDRRL